MCCQSMTEQQGVLQRQEREQQAKVNASVPDKKKLSELENYIQHLKKGKHHRYTSLSVIIELLL